MNGLKEGCKIVLLSILTVSIGIAFMFGIIELSNYLENEDNKKECYEVYATDDIVLKRCQKYFEK